MNNIIRDLHKQFSGGLAGQFDFTATPRHSKGQLFSWTVFDYDKALAIDPQAVHTWFNKGITLNTLG